MSRPVVVLPDLHGRPDLLDAALGYATQHYGPDVHFLGLGDAIDRGPRSLPVVKQLLDLQEAGKATLLMGNHERMCQEGLKYYRRFEASRSNDDYRRAIEGFSWWMRAGGETVRHEMSSQGQPLSLEQFPPLLARYIDSVQRRVVYVTTDGQIHDAPPSEPSVLVAHASPPVPHPKYPNPESAALWLRPFEGPFPMAAGVRYSVHGHTPTAVPLRLGQHYYIDLGAYQTGHLALLKIGIDAPEITVLEGAGDPAAARGFRQFGEPLPFRRVALQRRM